MTCLQSGPPRHECRAALVHTSRRSRLILSATPLHAVSKIHTAASCRSRWCSSHTEFYTPVGYASKNDQLSTCNLGDMRYPGS